MVTRDPIKSESLNGRTKEAFWRNIIGQLKQSGCTQAEFCRREGLNKNKVSWWKREIARRDAQVGRDTRKKAPVKRDDPRLIYWRDVFERFDQSKFSKEEFCAREEIKPGAFSWWRAELNRHDLGGKQIENPRTSEKNIFVPVGVKNDPVESAINGKKQQVVAEIDLISQTLRILAGADTQTIAAIITAVRSALL
jgi:hypothetical protein